MQYTEANLLFRPAASDSDPTLITRVTADQAGWDLLNMEVRRLNKDAEWTHETGDCEAALVILGGRCRVTSNQGSWETLGERPDVFSGKPYALYLPRHTAFKLTALTDNFEIAHCWVPTDRDHPAALVTPAESQVELRGGHNASRQINGVIMPGFDCHRIVCCEVYTPGGNWSSYPPHKHDSHRTDNAGNLTEADLEEFYFYKIDKPGGYALQRIYTDDRRIDSAVVAHDNDIVLVPGRCIR